MQLISYLRVSTSKQSESRLGLEAQQQAVKNFLNTQPQAKLLDEYIEIESGRKNKRPILEQAINHCHLTNSTLLIAKLDRLSRDVHFLTGLMKENVRFIACDNPQANELTVQLLSVVAADEVRNCSLRTKAALQAAKARGVVLGNPYLDLVRNTDTTNAREQFKSNTKKFYQRIHPVIASLQEKGFISYRSIATELNRLGFQSRQGKNFFGSTVKTIIQNPPP